MAEVHFFHPNPSLKRQTLNVEIKPDAIQWGYGLNTANFPTYGGEVVQILSAYFDDVTITGTVRTYKEMEQIYGYFIDYMQIASQGKDDNTVVDQFDGRPMQMNYYERGWTFDIYPKALPGMKYGRDVIAPTWTMVAAVHEPDADFQETFLDTLTANFLGSEGVQLFGQATMAEFVNPTDDPFSDPLAKDQTFKKDKPRSEYGQLADWYNNLIPSYLHGEFKDLTADYSKPTFLSGKQETGVKNTGTPKAKTKVDKKVQSNKKK